jgi:translation initiation factor IF-2
MPATTQNKNSELEIERPPVVSVMGHIDHGKSTLLDFIRSATTTAREAGGITQHLGAYEVLHERNGEKKTITFLDTPGHEAFQKMRERGATVADIAILVVSAEEGVKPQTLEAYRAITEAGTPMIVAINKIDRPEANIEHTKQSLAESGIFVEGYGGTVSWVPISAKTGEGIDDLIDMILLTAELETLRGNPATEARGIVIETSLDPRKGSGATLIIKDGTLKSGMFIVSGDTLSPVRLMEDYAGKKITEARFSAPVRVTGWTKLPEVGAIWQSFATKKEAEQAAKLHGGSASNTRAATPEDERTIIPVVIKTDVAGTIDAIRHEIKKLETDRVAIRILAATTGTVAENDIKLAGTTSGGIVLAFGTKIDSDVSELAERLKVDVQAFTIIYKLSEWLGETVTARTPKRIVETVKGRLKIIRVFSRTKDKQVIGGRVTEGAVGLGDQVHIRRRDAVIGEGKLLELQQQKVAVKEVAAENECGVLAESRIEIAPGDVLESISRVEA